MPLANIITEELSPITFEDISLGQIVFKTSLLVESRANNIMAMLYFLLCLYRQEYPLKAFYF